MMMTGSAFLRSLACIIALAVSVPSSASDADIETAINKAGRQRMLSQRVVKAYAMVGLGIETQQGQAILRESLAVAEQQLAELKQFVASEEARRSLSTLESDWSKLKAVLANKPSRESASELNDASEAVLVDAHRLTLAYEAMAGMPEYRLINIAGRQRMLSQRLAKFYLLRLWGVNSAAASMELNMARAEFSSGMHQLSAQQADPAINDVLNRLDARWIRYRTLLANPRAAKEVIAMSEAILADCENLVTLFERRAMQRKRPLFSH